MRPSILNPETVAAALRRVEKRLVNTRKRTNVAAARAMKAGDYDEANTWMDIGRSLADFSARFTTFADEWKALVHAARVKTKASKPSKPKSAGKASCTPEWKLSTPVLKVLVARGGSATLSELIADLAANLEQELNDADRKMVLSRGVPRWQVTLLKTYRQCQREGWIEKQKRKDGLWRITREGRGIAEEPKAKVSAGTV